MTSQASVSVVTQDILSIQVIVQRAHYNRAAQSLTHLENVTNVPMDIMPAMVVARLLMLNVRNSILTQRTVKAAMRDMHYCKEGVRFQRSTKNSKLKTVWLTIPTTNAFNALIDSISLTINAKRSTFSVKHTIS